MPRDTGRHFLSIPGPSVIPDEVLRAMHRPAVNIYEGPLIDLTYSLYPDLKHVVGTDGQAFIYIANGHGAWEATLANVFSAGGIVSSSCQTIMNLMSLMGTLGRS